ncbi:MAG: hypothetical protein QUS33_04320 [Dehalococcoidia bacterium]|nr:hypothetical protein [Dehalococcoidia bacterium]
MDSIEGIATILKGEEVIFGWACDLAKKVAEYVLEKVDEHLIRSLTDSQVCDTKLNIYNRYPSR